MQLEYLELRKKLMKHKKLFSLVHNFQEFRRHGRERRKIKRVQKHGYQLAQKLYDTLENSGFEYFYTYGSLLGLVRDGQFIPYDNDLDLGLLKTDDFTWEKFQKYMESNGFRRHREFSWDGKITEQAYEYKKINIDFFLYEKEEDHLVTYSYFNNRKNQYKSIRDVSVEGYHNKLFTGFRYITAHGVKCRVPENAEDLLQEVYDVTWKTPIKNWDYKQAKARFEIDGAIGKKTLY